MVDVTNKPARTSGIKTGPIYSDTRPIRNAANVPTIYSGFTTCFLPDTRVYNLLDISSVISGIIAAIISSMAPVYHTSKITIISGCFTCTFAVAPVDHFGNIGIITSLS
jgi:hypothetical protein